ncbi:MAG: PAS domain S-box protein [Calditrichia bacterium]
MDEMRKTKSKLTRHMEESTDRAKILEAMEREYEETRKELERINRAYKTLSECNQVLVRVKEESQLLQDICHLIVDVGGYRLAWVGMALNDKRKSVRAVAQSGFEDGYLKSINISWADNKLGRGPTGTAIRTGRPSKVRSIISDPDYTPWRKEAAKRGFESSIALPLITENQTLGALNIYATEPDAFDAQEEQLLLELARDIAYGIMALRHRKEQEKAESKLRERENLFRSLTETTTSAIFIVQGDHFKYMNQAGINITGYSLEELYQMKFWDVVHPDQREVIKSRGLARQKGEAVEPHYTFRIVRRDGTERWLDFTATYIEYEGKPAMLGTAFDITGLKESEKALQDSEFKFRTLADFTYDWEFWMDPSGKFIYVSPSCERISGYQPKDFLDSDRLFMNIIHPDDRVKIQKRLEIWVSMVSNPIRDNNGNFFGVRGSIRDISERVKAEEDLRKSEEHYRFLFEKQGEGMAFIDPEENFAFSNSVAESVFGLPPGKLDGRNLREFMSPESFKFIQKQTGKRRHGEKSTYTIEIIRPDGEKRLLLVTATPQFDDSGQYQGAFGIFRDDTVRQQTQIALRESEEKYRLVVENANEAIYVVQNDLIVFVNPKLSELTGFSGEELSGKPLADLLHPEGRNMVLKQMDSRLKGEKDSQPFSFRILSKQNDVKWIECTSVFITWENKPATLNFLLDVTERKAIEKEKEHIQAQLLHAQKMEAIGTLAGGLAHDFNNLLTTIQGYADLALMTIDESHRFYWNFKQINRAVVRAAGLTSQLLLFSRKQPAEVKLVDLNESVEHLLLMVKRIIGREIEIINDLDPDLWGIMGDSGNIEQIVMNLLLNARDAMPGGGNVKVKTENTVFDTKKALAVSDARPGRFVLLSVTDNGTGMEPEVLEHIFEPFFTTKETGKGTGLGLSVVYGIVKQHQGWINVSSKKGEGTNFQIYFPATLAKRRKSEVRKIELRDLPTRRERILYIEDEKEIRDFSTIILKEYEYTVIPAASAKEALEVFKKEKGNFDLIFSDVVLPDGNGIQLVEKLLESAPELPVLFTSGYMDNRSQWPVIQEKGYAFLKKPYSLTELVKTIHEVLSKKE